MFRYLRDPLWLTSVACYAVSRVLLQPHLGPGFMRNHFHDLLLIPAALPLVLWLQRQLGWRTSDLPPTIGEIVLHLVIWTCICEWLGPRFFRHATADWRDAIAYFAGAVLAAAWWHRPWVRSGASDVARNDLPPCPSSG